MLFEPVASARRNSRPIGYIGTCERSAARLNLAFDPHVRGRWSANATEQSHQHHGGDRGVGNTEHYRSPIGDRSAGNVAWDNHEKKTFRRKTASAHCVGCCGAIERRPSGEGRSGRPLPRPRMWRMTHHVISSRWISAPRETQSEMVLAAIHWEPPPARYSLDRGGVWPRTSSDYSHAALDRHADRRGQLWPTLSGFSDPKPFGRHFCSRDPVRYLLKGDVASIVGHP